MVNKHEQLTKSRLGRLLVNRGYISEAQLEEALVIQTRDGVMLGEALLSQGWISEKDLKRTLNHQKRYRFTAAVVTMVAAPLQPLTALAASPVAAIPISNNKVELSVNQLGKFSGMQMLDDEEMAGVSAQGFGMMPSMGISMGQNADAIAAGLQHKYRDDEDYEQPDDEQIAYEMADTVLTMAGLGPISNLLEANVTVEGISYQEGRAPIEFLPGGKMKFYMPTEIARISMEDIRVKGNTSGDTMGSIYMSDIRFHPNSSYTIGAK